MSLTTAPTYPFTNPPYTATSSPLTTGYGVAGYLDRNPGLRSFSQSTTTICNSVSPSKPIPEYLLEMMDRLTDGGILDAQRYLYQSDTYSSTRATPSRTYSTTSTAPFFDNRLTDTQLRDSMRDIHKNIEEAIRKRMESRDLLPFHSPTPPRSIEKFFEEYKKNKEYENALIKSKLSKVDLELKPLAKPTPKPFNPQMELF